MSLLFGDKDSCVDKMIMDIDEQGINEWKQQYKLNHIVYDHLALDCHKPTFLNGCHER